MSVSLAEIAELNCPRCGHNFQARVWLIIEAAERPDLIDQAREGTLHRFPCPNCSHDGQVDVPLLVLQPSRNPPLLFSPASDTSPEEDQAQAAELINLLQDRLRERWRSDWLAQGLPAIARDMLPVALSDEPEQTLRHLRAQAEAEAERLRQQNPEAYRHLDQIAQQALDAGPLLQTVQQFIQANTWDATQRVVEQHPELLGDEATSLLSQLLEASRSQGDTNILHILTEHLALLHRCRQVGVDHAFAEKQLPPELLAQAAEAGMTPEQLLKAQRASRMPPELREVLTDLAANGVEIRSLADLEAALAARPDLRARLEAMVEREGSAFPPNA